ncbi:hypothetical protein FRX31_026671 [Thalictrum thalictroides]|uniref:Uncharacterized protein n=1 Tax=Thalictrum thalictroides TaxID=46969 RepID=A0A7J6VHH4_THATH|nr:hypothetical protein FRX31_026671 [Thalictrum thalictroides]
MKTGFTYMVYSTSSVSIDHLFLSSSQKGSQSYMVFLFRLLLSLTAFHSPLHCSFCFSTDRVDDDVIAATFGSSQGTLALKTRGGRRVVTVDIRHDEIEGFDFFSFLLSFREI